MKRTTIMLPEGLDLRLRTHAEASGRSIAEVIRDILEEQLPRPAGYRFSFTGVGASSGHIDLAQGYEDELLQAIEESAVRRERPGQDAR